jgi:spermidine synthase
MKSLTKKTSLLLFGSGAAALIYQMAWLRDLRYVFGSSTYATASVLAIFMGGLGFGGLIIGRRLNNHPNPLRVYAILELVITGYAILTPFLIHFIESIYLASGGSMALGLPTATAFRLVLSILVLGIPTFLMGGTLPATAKAIGAHIITEQGRTFDSARRHIGILYGVNTLGGVCGVILATFFLFEKFGTHTTLWSAASINAFVCLLAFHWSRPLPVSRPVSEQPSANADHDNSRSLPTPRGLNPLFINLASGIMGFTFLLMELVWYRMLSPILGGTTYTFGLILAVALFSIAIGGFLHSLTKMRDRHLLALLALTCALEAMFLAIPYAFGDWIAVFTALLYPLDWLGMSGQMFKWLLITSIVVMPTALVAGYQFPLCITLLGKGHKNIALHTGHIYASNTIGAILGSLAGGFGLIPLLGALGCWRAVIMLLCCLCLATLFTAHRSGQRSWRNAPPLFVLGLTFMLLLTTGPTAAWRHSGIGASRTNIMAHPSFNEIMDWMNMQRRHTIWQQDGLESSVALNKGNGLSFVLNGKIDGNAKEDAPTQVMAPLVSAILHPAPQAALVVGLGTGSSAGWLAEIPSMQRVDVVELEPIITKVAEMCGPVNREVMKNAKVNLIFGDAREVLLTSQQQYDLIVSEPSNPYRSGIASLYTKEFYAAVAKRLKREGSFSQWVQSYEVDGQTIRTIYNTLSSVFPYIEAWETEKNDLLFVCSQQEIPYRVDLLRSRIKEEPFRTALAVAWGVTDLEGFLARYVAGAPFAKKISTEGQKADLINTDNRTLIEFTFSRTLGKEQIFSPDILRNAAQTIQADRPPFRDGSVDWQLVAENALLTFPLVNQEIPLHPAMRGDQQQRALAFNQFLHGNLPAALDAWREQDRQPEYPLELIMVAEAAAEMGDSGALAMAEKLRASWPAAIDAILARYFWRRGDRDQAVTLLVDFFIGVRTDPWVPVIILDHALNLASEMSWQNPDIARQIHTTLAEPFSVYILEQKRMDTRLDISAWLNLEYSITALHEYEPYPYWNSDFLYYRHQFYKEINDPLAEKARHDFNIYSTHSAQTFHDTTIP